MLRRLCLSIYFLKPEEEELGASAPSQSRPRVLDFGAVWTFGRIKPLQSIDSITFRVVWASKRSRSAFKVEDLEHLEIIIH